MYKLITLLMLACLSSNALAQLQCTDVFSNVLATFNANNGDVRFQQNSRIINSDGTIDFQQNRIAHDNNAGNTCGNQLCVASGSFAEQLSLQPFMFSNSNTDITIPQNSNNATILAGQFDTVTVTQNQALSFVSVNSEYIIDELILQQGAVVNFAPGDYWIDDLRMAQNSRIEANGDGVVRLFVTDVDDRNSNVRVINQNAQINPNQSSRNFLIVSYDDFRFSGQNTSINAHLYSVDDVIIGNNSQFTGSIVLGDALVIQPNAQVTFDNQAPRNLSFGDLCQSNTLIASYEFEEVSPAADSTNNNDGGFVGDAIDVRLAGATSNQTCSVLDVPLNQSIGNNDGFETPINVGQQLGNAGTISFWYRSDVQWNQGFFGLDRKLFDASLPFGNQNDDEDKFFFLVLQNNGSLLFGLEDEDDNNGLLVTTRFNFAADEWVHIAATWDVENQQMALFINGAPAVSGFIENQLSGAFSQTNTLRLGDNRSSYLPNVGTSPNSGDGQFDSLRLYNFAQSTQEVDADRIVSDVSNCGAPLEAVAFYQFQPNQVPDDSLDFSDGNLVGNATGVVLPVPTNVCGVLDVPLNQVAAPSDAFNTQINVGQTMGNRGTISFWYRSEEDWDLGGSGLDRKLFDASIPFGNGDDDEDKFFFLNLQSNGRLRFGFEDPNDNNSILETAVLNFGADEWVHVAATWDAVTRQMTLFLNGSAASATFLERNAFGRLSDTNTLFIGDNRSTYLPGVGTTGNSSNGQFDEVRLYRFDQTSAQVLADINAQPPGCFDDILVDHYRLNYGASFTCAASEVNVQACANDNCDVLATSNASLTLTTDNGSFDTTNLTFVGSTISELSLGNPGVAVIDAINRNPNVEVRCFNNGVEDNSCEVNFTEVGLTVSYGGLPMIPNGVSQVAFDEEIVVGVDQLGACNAELEGRSLEIAVQCTSFPNSCAADQLQINGTIINNIENFNSTGINFDATGQATIPANFLQYRDAGRIELLFRDAGAETTGSSNDFVMRPFIIARNRPNDRMVAGVASRLDYEAVGAEGIPTPNYNPSNLQVQVIKTIPEPNPDTAQGELRFFESEFGSGFTSQDPDDAMFFDIDESDFDFIGNGGRSNELGPIYSEVGTVTLALRDENYLGSNITLNALTIVSGAGLVAAPVTLGQYIPAYFEVTSETPSLTNTCERPATNDPFSYIGQNITPPLDSVDLTFTVTALNADGQTTSNYGGRGMDAPNDLWRLNIIESDEDSITPRASDDELNNPRLLRGVETDHLRFISGSLEDGVDGFISGTFDDNDSETDFDGEATYRVSSLVARHIKTAQPQLPTFVSFRAQFGNVRNNNGTPDDLTDDTLQVVDSDDVCIQSTFPGECLDFDDVILNGGVDQNDDAVPLPLRYGRLVLENAFGPETADIRVPFRTEFFSDAGIFETNTGDNCTNVAFVNSDFDRTPVVDFPAGITDLRGFIGPVASSGQVLQGRTLPSDGILVPTDNRVGQLSLSLIPQNSDTDQVWNDFLNFDWNGDGFIDQNDMPSAIVTFGIFRGNDRIIHWREIPN